MKESNACVFWSWALRMACDEANLSNGTAQAQARSETDTDPSQCIQVHCCIQITAGLIGLCFPGHLRRQFALNL